MPASPPERTAAAALLLFLLLVGPAPAAAQAPGAFLDTLALAEAGAEAGLRDGRDASVSGARWGSAAATFFFTPVVGGVGSLVAAQLSDGLPPTVPDTVPEAAHLAYRDAYREAYQAAFKPRYRRAVRTSVLVTSAVFLAAAALLAG